MKSILGIVFFISPFTGITACENIKFNEVQKNEEVFYDVSNIVITAKGRTFLMTFLLMSVSRKNSLLMVTRQFHMHHTMDFNMLVI